MIIEIGHFALILALVVATAQMIVPMWGAHVRDARLMAVGDSAAVVQFGLLVISFLALMHAFVTSDFSVLNVADNSHSEKPLIYRIAGVWGNHEGSMLLWVLILGALRRSRGSLRAQPSGDAAGKRARRTGFDRDRVPAVHALHVKPVRARRSGPV